MTASLDVFQPVGLVCMQMLLYTGMWGVAWLIVVDERRPIVHWLVFTLCSAAGLVLFGMRPDGPLWLTELVSNILMLIGFAALRRGAGLFLGLPFRMRNSVLAVACGSLALVLVGPAPEALAGRGMVMASLMSVIFLGMARETYGPMCRQFSRRIAITAVGPVVLFGLFNLVRFVLVLWRLVHQDPGQAIQVPTGTHVLVLYSGLFTAGMFNFLFVFMVVLRLVGKLTFMAERDPLTGLLNRRVMQNLLQREWDRHRRQGVPFALVSVDVDHFKRINDRHGHPMGDEVLRSVADALQQQTRTIDSTARMGGEEFLLLLPGCDASGGQIAAQRLRQALKGLEFQPADGSTLNVTASFGVTTPVSGDQGVEGLLQRVDGALYTAKATGRDRVVVDAGPAPDQPPVSVPPAVAGLAEIADRVPA